MCSYSKITVGGTAPSTDFLGPPSTSGSGSSTTSTTMKSSTFQVTFTSLKYVLPAWHTQITLEVTSKFSRSASYTPTRPILVSNMPRVLEVYDHPPSTVEIGTEFMVSVKARLTDGSPLANATILVNATRSSKDMMSTLKNKLMNLLGNSDSSITTLADLVDQTSHAVIDSSRCMAVTDEDGVATFYLLFESGISGKYTLRFETAMSSLRTSDETEEFSLVNEIASANITDDTTQEISVKFEKSNDEYQSQTIIIPTDPAVYLKDSDGSVITDQYILRTSAQLINYDDFTAAADALGVDPNDLTLATIAGAANFSTESTAADKLKKLWNVLTNAGQIVGATYSITNAYVGTYNSVTSNSTTGKYAFNNVSFTIDSPGTYIMILTVNGIEARSGQIVVSDSTVTSKSTFYQDCEAILPYVIIGLLILINIPILTRYFSVATVAVVILQICLVTQSDKGSSYQIFSYIILYGIVLLCVWAFVEEIITHGENNFNVMRDEAYMDYCRRLMNIPTIRDEETRLQGIFREFKDLTRPFFVAKKKEDYDAFYFPQRFIFSVFLGVIAFIYVAFVLWNFVFALLDEYPWVV